MQSARKSDPELDAILGDARSETEVNAKMEAWLKEQGPPTQLQPKLGSPHRMRVHFRAYDPGVAYVRTHSDTRIRHCVANTKAVATSCVLAAPATCSAMQGSCWRGGMLHDTRASIRA